MDKKKEEQKKKQEEKKEIKIGKPISNNMYLFNRYRQAFMR